MAANHALFDHLKSELSLQANPEAATQMQAYMKSAMPFYGVKAPLIKSICRQTFKAFPLVDFEEWQQTVLSLWRNANYRELRYAAIQLCEAKLYQKFQTLDTITLYEEIIVTGAWWDFVDPIASHRIAYLLKTYPKPMKSLMREWSADDNMWKRRTAIICQLLFKKETDLKLLYACIEPSLHSKEFFLQKAIGWALRSYAWVDLDEVIRYVEQHQQDLSNLSKREALKNQTKIKSAK